MRACVRAWLFHLFDAVAMIARSIGILILSFRSINSYFSLAKSKLKRIDLYGDALAFAACYLKA
jgi:hypothetical protein